MPIQDRENRFTEQLRRNHRQLFGYIYGLLRNYGDAQDVFQQTSLTLWEKFDEYRPGTSFASWACSIARFKALNFLRRHRRYVAHFSEAFQQKLAAIQAAVPAEEINARRRRWKIVSRSFLPASASCCGSVLAVRRR